MIDLLCTQSLQEKREQNTMDIVLAWTLIEDDTQQQPTANAVRTVSVCPHPFCGKRGHKTTWSKHCLTNPDRLKRDGLEAACLAAVAAIDEADDVEAEAPNNIASNVTGTADKDAADDLDAYKSQPFEEFEDDLFYQTGTWSEDEDGMLVPRSSSFIWSFQSRYSSCW